MSKGNNKDQIVPSTPNTLSTRSVGLVRRGLQHLTVTLPKVGKRILLGIGKHSLATEDQERINGVVGEILSSAGYEVRTTTHPSEVLALAADFRPDVAFIGLIAQEIDGVTLSEQLAAGFPDLKIILTGEDVWEWALRLLLHKGILCDALECPFERRDLLEMINTWASGSDHIDPATHLRDARHYRMALFRSAGVSKSKDFGLGDHSGPLMIHIDLVRRASAHLSLQSQISFLQSLGDLLARYARDGFAYRHGETQFAILLPRASSAEGFSTSNWLVQELNALLNDHNLGDDYIASVSLVSPPDNALSKEQVLETVRELWAQGKTTEANNSLEAIIRDTWTGLYTERFFMEAFSAEWKRSERNNRIFSLIDIDLGDIDALLGKTRDWLRVLLSRVGDTIDKTCRKSDCACHYNLGEFLIILPETSAETACSLAQQLHSRLKETAADVLSGYRPPLTLSVATYPSDGESPVDLVHSLGRAMVLLQDSTRDGVATESKGILSPV